MRSKKRVLIVAASPRRNGNSTILAERAADGVKAAGGEVNLVRIGNMKIAPCNACDSCRSGQGRGCVIMDDMQGLYPKIRDAGGVILATPVYWFSASAQMKAFIDRTYAMGDEEEKSYAFTGKDVGLILTYADADVFASGGVNALRTFQDICRYSKANWVGAVYGTADKAGDARSDVGLIQKAYELGSRVAASVEEM